jgi:tetratricopeptide (TPR) repeat protein
MGAILALIIAAWLPLAPAFAQAEPEAYDLRGKQVERLYKNHTELLETAFRNLRLIVETETPDLLPELDEQPPAKPDYGYQLIPEILPDPDAACADTSQVADSKPYRPKSSRFSWTITEARIDKNVGRLVDPLNSGLKALTGISEPEERQQAIEEMVETYLELQKEHRFIEGMIQHNWLWQREISLRKPKYDQSTLIHDAIVERTLLIDALSADSEEDYEKALEKTAYAGANYAGLKTELSARIDTLNDLINAASRGLTPRDHVRFEQPRPHLWVFHIPVITDIEDMGFLQEFKRAVEQRWCLRDGLHDGEDEFRIEIELRRLSAVELYGNDSDAAESDKIKVPGQGEQISLIQHCRKFPKDAARLSSGARKTYIRAGCMFVGPEDIGESTLIHEFGHLLGFADEYVRGYRDLGVEGYEILEILADGKDIMASISAGGIHRYHFDALIAGAHFRSGLTFASNGEHQAAVSAYRKAIEVNDDTSFTASAYNNLGWSLNQLGKYHQAIVAFKKALEIRPGWSLASNNLNVVRKKLKQQEEQGEDRIKP